MRITEEYFPGVPPMDYVMYERGAEVTARDGAETLARIVNPYFNRDYFKFCSHRQTPPDKKLTEFAGAVKSGNIVYAAQPLFYGYAESRSMICRDIVKQLIITLGVEPMIKTSLPSFAETTLRKKGDNFVLHILNYIVERKSRRLDTIEESIPLYGAGINVRTGREPSAVFIAPGMEKIPFTYAAPYTAFTLEKIGGYEIVEIAF